MKKTLLAITLIAATSILYANNGETKTKQEEQHTYYVTSQQTIGGEVFYNVTPNDPGCPNTGSKPCEVLSDQLADANGRIPQSAVLSVESTRP
ncbi:MAG: hypothetical protein LBF27_14035 [Sphingobacterium sp.]|nr:hypothetical protein [Sphingobacterium sp.]